MPDVLMRGVSEARYDGTPGGSSRKRGRRGGVRAGHIAEATEAWGSLVFVPPTEPSAAGMSSLCGATSSTTRR